MTIAVWIVSGLVALFALGAGTFKLVRPHDALAEQQPWARDFSASQVRTIGVLEIAGAIGVIVPVATGIAPVVTPIAAIGLALVQLGAILVHARRREVPMILVNLVLLALATFVAVARILGY